MTTVHASFAWLLIVAVSGCRAGIRDRDDLAAHLGETVTLKGVLSDTPWQHPVAPPEDHLRISYLDISEKHQVVIYTRDEVTCGETKAMEVKGEVIEIEVPMKRRGNEPPSTLRAIQVVAETWRCR